MIGRHVRAEFSSVACREGGSHGAMVPVIYWVCNWRRAFNLKNGIEGRKEWGVEIGGWHPITEFSKSWPLTSKSLCKPVGSV